MYDSGSFPEVKLVEVETGFQQATAAAAIGRKNLDDCKLYATVDGFVGARAIEPGLNVSPGFTAIKIVNIEKVCAKVSVSENKIARIKRGEDAQIRVGALVARFEGATAKPGNQNEGDEHGGCS
ncbi:MAG: efflux RND transporter periplasmic adaptor subunit [bacterium]